MTRVAVLAAERADEGGVAGRDLEQLAGAFALVGEHAAAEQAELDALKAPPVDLEICYGFLNFQCRHGNPESPDFVGGRLRCQPGSYAVVVKYL